MQSGFNSARGKKTYGERLSQITRQRQRKEGVKKGAFRRRKKTEVKRDEAPLKNSLHRGIITGDGAAGGEGGRGRREGGRRGDSSITPVPNGPQAPSGRGG